MNFVTTVRAGCPCQTQGAVFEVSVGEDVGEADLVVVGGGVELQGLAGAQVRLAVVHATVLTAVKVQNLERKGDRMEHNRLTGLLNYTSHLLTIVL